MFYLLITYPHSEQQHLMNGGGKAICAKEDNHALLIEVGERLLEENVISSYQLVTTVGEEVNVNIVNLK